MAEKISVFFLFLALKGINNALKANIMIPIGLMVIGAGGAGSRNTTGRHATFHLYSSS